METIINESHILNKFYGEKVTFDEFRDILNDLEGKCVVAEVLKGLVTAQYYEDFNWAIYEEKNILILQDDSMDIPPIFFFIHDIEEIIIGEGIYLDHYLLKLRIGVEIMLWVSL